MSKLSKLKPIVRLSVVNPDTDKQLGVRPRHRQPVHRRAQDTGSLNTAAKSMGMAYSKAWRIIKDTEAALDVQLLYRDGAHGSRLTEDCEQILAAYQAIEEQLQTQAEDSFEKQVDGQ